MLIVGSGSREHALAWALSAEVEVHVAPGNAGIAQEFTCHDVDQRDSDGVVTLAQSLAVECCVIGPEDPLILGLADRLRAENVPTFGPGAQAALLEGSKAFAKAQMNMAGVPTARHEVFNDPKSAATYARSRFADGKQVAVKASGAALGKGVVVCTDFGMAEDSIQSMMVDREFGEAGATVVIEDRLIGNEFSLIALVSGTSYRCFLPVQDYKRALDGDRGPNTGGMGSVCPPAWLDESIAAQAEATVVKRIIDHLASNGISYRGALFAGLLVQDGVPLCLEYNVRFGDPETQSLMMLCEAGFAEAVVSVALGNTVPEWSMSRKAATTIVCASRGYPGKIDVGNAIKVGALEPGARLFWGGVQADGGTLVNTGGRVVSVSAIGETLTEANARAYRSLEAVHFSGKQFRTDIGGEPTKARAH